MGLSRRRFTKEFKLARQVPRRVVPPDHAIGGTLARPYGDLNALLVGGESGVVVDESPETVAAVCSENNYSAVSVSGFGVFALGGRPSLVGTPSAEILFGPVEIPSRPRQRR